MCVCLRVLASEIYVYTVCWQCARKSIWKIAPSYSPHEVEPRRAQSKGNYIRVPKHTILYKEKQEELHQEANYSRNSVTPTWLT